MAVTRADAVLRALGQGRRGGVFFLFGDEELLKERLASQIVDAHLDPSTRDFNLDQLRGGDMEAETLGSVLATPPMLAEWRVVLVRDAQVLAGAPRGRATIEQLLDKPTPGLALVLLANIPDGSKAQFYERLKREAVAVELASLPESDLPGWLIEEAEVRGLQLEAAAARAMASAIGSDLGVLARELDKLRDYVGERKTVLLADVEAVVGKVARQDRWAWLDLVGDGRVAEARRAVPVLLETGDTAVGLVIALGTHFLRLALAVNGGVKALETELPPRQRWLASRAAQQARRWTPATVDAVLDDLLRADRLLKSASMGEERVLDELLLRLEARTRRPARR
jgi:DNA polymerase III subunit delta